MLSTFHGIEVGKKGLMANNMGIEIVGHNLGNIETEGFSRQKVNLTAYYPLYEPSANRVETPGQIGTGVVVENIERVRDQAIDDRLQYEKGGLGFWQMKQEFLAQIERIYNEPGDPNLRTTMDAYWEAWQKVAQNPTERAARDELIERTQAMTTTFNKTFGSLYELRQNANALVIQRVNEVNNMAKEIADLNIQIVKSEAMGDSPNDLYDKRDLLLDRLSKVVNIKVERNNKHEVIVYIGTENLVQGGTVHGLTAPGNPDNEGMAEVRWDDGRLVKMGGGELPGLISVRDDDIRTAMWNTDALAANIADATNELHRQNFGLNNTTGNDFFAVNPITPYKNGDYDFSNDGVPDGTALFKVSGKEALKPDTVIGTNGFLNFGPARQREADIVITYQASDTVKDVMDRINRSNAGVVAYLNDQGQLTFKARYPMDKEYPAFVIRHLEDSGNFLTGFAGLLSQSGQAGAFDYRTVGDNVKFNVPPDNLSISPQKHPASWFVIDSKILSNPDVIAAAAGMDTTGDGKTDRINGFGDNRGALSIAGLRHKDIMVERQSTFGEYFKSMVSDMGTRSETAQVNHAKDTKVVESLENLRQQVSGVNVDEEMTKMLMFQHGYNASARLVTTVDRMIEVLIRMGA